MMNSMRMNPYDFSDIAYDAYLLNGHSPASPWQAMVKQGDIVRLPKSAVMIKLKSVIGGGDNGEPVITIMLPEED